MWPVLYVIATIYITIVPMIASPVETGTCTFDSSVAVVAHKHVNEKLSAAAAAVVVVVVVVAAAAAAVAVAIFAAFAVGNNLVIVASATAVVV